VAARDSQYAFKNGYGYLLKLEQAMKLRSIDNGELNCFLSTCEIPQLPRYCTLSASPSLLDFTTAGISSIWKIKPSTSTSQIDHDNTLDWFLGQFGTLISATKTYFLNMNTYIRVNLCHYVLTGG
jgi:hypothetical protein